ncbi:GAF domain-containing protein, partial [Patescibacteria group bacterium]|nr:GAF domain-containing protein [Patescibacteria group bacterium]
MEIKNIILLIVALLDFSIGLFIVIKNSKSQINRYFFLLTFFTSSWAISILLFRISTEESLSLIFMKVAYISATLIAASLWQLSHIFPSPKKILFSQKLLLYIPTLILISLILIPNFLTKYIIYYDWGKEVVLGKKELLIFTIYFLFFFYSAFYIFWKKYKQSQGLKKAQIKYIFSGTFISGILGVIFNLIGPWIGNSKYLWVGPSFLIIMVIFFGYAIIRHRLLNIKLVLSRSVLYFILVALITGGFILVLFLASQFFTEAGLNQNLVAGIAALIIVLTFEPIKNFFAKITDKIFYKEKIDYQTILRQTSTILSEEIELHSLVEKLDVNLTEGLKVKGSKLYLLYGEECFLPVEEMEKRRTKKRNGDYPSCRSILVKEIKNESDPIVFDEYERKMIDQQDEKVAKKMEKVLKDMEGLKAAVVAPVFRDKEMTALLILDQKVSGDPYTDDDIKFIQVISPQISSSLEKAKLFSEVKQFNVKLQKEVDKATADLKKANEELKGFNAEIEQKNKNLNTLQRMSSLILQNVEFGKVAQEIVSSVPREITDCQTALLCLVDKPRKNLVAHSMASDPPVAKKIGEIVGSDITKYKVPLTSSASTKNQLALAVKNKKVQVTGDISEILVPPLPEDVVAGIKQIKPSSKTNITIPIIIGDTVVGV